MSKSRLLLTIILSLAALGLILFNLYLPSPKGVDFKGFSAERASNDINYISKEPHSVLHLYGRARVRDYLISRLNELGVKAVQHKYDSIKDYNGDVYDIINVYSQIDPLSAKAKSYLLLVAHYDSRNTTNVKGKSVTSLGAADDGYGLATILEVVSNVLQTRDKWVNGIRILFTDSEETGLYGIKYAIRNNSEIFTDVALVINIEARGVKGPAILFETSPGNSKLVDLYKNAKTPFSYSFTSAVYNLLPNYTDFTLLKDTLPGLNFSVIDNLNYYHTDLDNFDNISLKSVQHYGEQVLPVVNKFIHDSCYSNSESLTDSEDSIYFTIPFLGLFTFSRGLYITVKYAISGLFLLLLGVYLKQKRFSPKNLGYVLLMNVIFIAVSSAIAYLVSLIAAYFNGLEYKMINLAYVKYEYIITALTLTIFTLIYILVYSHIIRKRHLSNLSFIASGNILMITLSFVLYYKIGDSVITFIPTLISVLLLFINIFNYTRYFNIVGIIIMVLFVTPVIYMLIIALTIGSLFVVTALWGLFLWLILPLTDRFVRRGV